MKLVDPFIIKLKPDEWFLFPIEDVMPTHRIFPNMRDYSHKLKVFKGSWNITTAQLLNLLIVFETVSLEMDKEHQRPFYYLLSHFPIGIGCFTVVTSMCDMRHPFFCQIFLEIDAMNVGLLYLQYFGAAFLTYDCCFNGDFKNSFEVNQNLLFCLGRQYSELFFHCGEQSRYIFMAVLLAFSQSKSSRPVLFYFVDSDGFSLLLEVSHQPTKFIKQRRLQGGGEAIRFGCILPLILLEQLWNRFGHKKHLKDRYDITSGIRVNQAGHFTLDQFILFSFFEIFLVDFPIVFIGMSILFLSEDRSCRCGYYFGSQPIEFVLEVFIAVAGKTGQFDPRLHILPLNQGIVVEEVPQFFLVDDNNTQEPLEKILDQLPELILGGCGAFMIPDESRENNLLKEPLQREEVGVSPQCEGQGLEELDSPDSEGTFGQSGKAAHKNIGSEAAQIPGLVDAVDGDVGQVVYEQAEVVCARVVGAASSDNRQQQARRRIPVELERIGVGLTHARNQELAELVEVDDVLPCLLWVHLYPSHERVDAVVVQLLAHPNEELGQHIDANLYLVGQFRRVLVLGEALQAVDLLFIEFALIHEVVIHSFQGVGVSELTRICEVGQQQVETAQGSAIYHRIVGVVQGRGQCASADLGHLLADSPQHLELVGVFAVLQDVADSFFPFLIALPLAHEVKQFIEASSHAQGVELARVEPSIAPASATRVGIIHFYYLFIL